MLCDELHVCVMAFLDNAISFVYNLKDHETRPWHRISTRTFMPFRGGLPMPMKSLIFIIEMVEQPFLCFFPLLKTTSQVILLIFKSIIWYENVGVFPYYDTSFEGVDSTLRRQDQLLQKVVAILMHLHHRDVNQINKYILRSNENCSGFCTRWGKWLAYLQGTRFTYSPNMTSSNIRGMPWPVRYSVNSVSNTIRTVSYCTCKRLLHV